MIWPIGRSEFSVSLRREGAAAVVTPAGEIDIATVAAVREELLSAEEGADVVVLDLREVTFFDTQGISLVIEEQLRLSNTGTRLVVVRAPPLVHRLFDIAGVTPRLTVVDDPSEALGGQAGG
jgi:anti-sigma B factor antagonist